MQIITLPARCDRATAETLLPEFHAALGCGEITIDATQTIHVGQAMLQVLVSARQSTEGVTIQPSDALRATATALGLHSVLFDEGDA